MKAQTYDDIHDWYNNLRNDDSISLVDNLIYPHLLELIALNKPAIVCDLGCGQGKLSRVIAKEGVKVYGIDNSKKLLKTAIENEKKESLGIIYIQDDAQLLYELPNNQFDGVICHMALMDMIDLNAVLKSVYRVLKNGGWFAFSITHPCFDSPHAKWGKTKLGRINRVIHEYFNEGFWKSENKKGIRGQVGANHRKLSTYLNACIKVGLNVKKVLEPEAGQVEIEFVPGYRIVPLFLMVVVDKAD